MIKKYIIIKGNPILFPVGITHADMVDANAEVESAGFFLIVKNEKGQRRNVICTGESISLSVSSRPEIDQEIIAQFLESDL